mmetsp:Transcript_1520/g.2490  ORF Transcript_1520/g.2490 Transcript_1520/m.2490 type:complete len:369 (-) Transcript_1520:508-1614(-)|eukprot:CAMPEP_0184320530 /NCGR_PEP_ID=MMETSP1049-20130417/114316_1 /TAXON_ID=77928 /ORGANISM="Proteomonas sulcata, Strain CCMP704" /LENGTH=368 /DNA_ID=CAMNT_0026641055 /DNA_START=64 /DNA_END=1170 /DNA_ORIENTATION=-
MQHGHSSIEAPAAFVGVKFRVQDDGEVRVEELTPGSPAAKALDPPRIGDQLLRVNGDLVPALISKADLTLLIANQCLQAKKLILGFRSDTWNEYSSVIQLPSDRRITSSALSPSVSSPSWVGVPESPDGLRVGGYQNGGTPNPKPRSSGRRTPEVSIEGLGFEGWLHGHQLPEQVSQLLEQMRKEVVDVNRMAQSKISEAEHARQVAEEELGALQDQAFSRIQQMQDQISHLKMENKSLKTELQQLNRTLRLTNKSTHGGYGAGGYGHGGYGGSEVPGSRPHHGAGDFAGIRGSAAEGWSLRNMENWDYSRFDAHEAPGHFNQPGTGSSSSSFGAYAITMEDGTELRVDPMTGKVQDLGEMEDSVELL